jgi:hypothetical protein
LLLRKPSVLEEGVQPVPEFVFINLAIVAVEFSAYPTVRTIQTRCFHSKQAAHKDTIGFFW